MTPWEMLEWLRADTLEVHVSINPQRAYYETVQQYAHRGDRGDRLFDDKAVEAEAIRRNELVEVQVYPDTPIGFHTVAHYDTGEAIRLMYETIKADREDSARRKRSEQAKAPEDRPTAAKDTE